MHVRLPSCIHAHIAIIAYIYITLHNITLHGISLLWITTHKITLHIDIHKMIQIIALHVIRQ